MISWVWGRGRDLHLQPGLQWILLPPKTGRNSGEGEVMWSHWRRSVSGVTPSNWFHKKTFLAAIWGVDWELAEWRHLRRCAVIQMKREETRAVGMERKPKIYAAPAAGQMAPGPEEHCDPRLFSGWRALFRKLLATVGASQKPVRHSWNWLHSPCCGHVCSGVEAEGVIKYWSQAP